MAKKKEQIPPKQRFRTIRVTGEVYDQVHNVVGDVASKGWKHYGIDRRDAPSITSVVAEAVGRLVKGAR